MARMPEQFPDPPPDLPISSMWNKRIDEAVDWCTKDAGVKHITERYLRTSTDDGKLRCKVIANKRMYSTEELYRFLVSHPGQTRGKRNRPAESSTGT